jgi:hypothetical protein
MMQPLADGLNTRLFNSILNCRLMYSVFISASVLNLMEGC